MAQRFVLAEKPLLRGVMNFGGASFGANVGESAYIDGRTRAGIARQMGDMILQRLNLKGEGARICLVAEQEMQRWTKAWLGKKAAAIGHRAVGKFEQRRQCRGGFGVNLNGGVGEFE